LPVGVHPRGFDAVHDAEVFAPGASVGAPPDAMFDGGQDWTIPALHPGRSRAQGHRYYAECVRAHAELASVLRIDHVMGLFRRFWIPEGMSAGDGVYVRLPGDELVAVLSLESHRNRTIIVGEDLGTVEPSVRDDLVLHRMSRMYVSQLAPDDPVPAGCVACVNTHDTPPFAAAWGDRPGALAALSSEIGKLANSEAWLVLVTLEDLWLETRSQNRPGTTTEHPNWQAKLRVSLDELAAREDLIALLRSAHRS
jgi:4-alpha-glucanotransferase